MLTDVDCGPSRFAIWREVSSENAKEVGRHLMEIFRERGPPAEILMDKSPAFRSVWVADICREWNVHIRYRAAYRLSGNGIVEQHHRTVKALAERNGKGPLWTVFWCNLAAKKGICKMLHKYEWRHPLICPHIEERSLSQLQLGDEMLVKHPGNRCTSRWNVGRVTGVTSSENVDVDGMPRHVLDLRRLFVDESDEGEDDVDTEEDEDEDDGTEVEVNVEDELQPTELRPAHQLKAPAWLQDYEW